MSTRPDTTVRTWLSAGFAAILTATTWLVAQAPDQPQSLTTLQNGFTQQLIGTTPIRQFVVSSLRCPSDDKNGLVEPSDGVLRVGVNPGDGAHVTKLLADAGLYVNEMRADAVSLEELFLTITSRETEEVVA